MSKIERVREPVADGALDAQIAERQSEGWLLVALEWQRPAGMAPRVAPGAVGGSILRRTEVPYGLQVAADFLHLEENPLEVAAMVVMLDLMVEDRPLAEVAGELNRRSFRTRQGTEWTPSTVFDLVPRLVEVGPDIFGTGGWAELREQRRDRRQVAAQALR